MRVQYIYSATVLVEHAGTRILCDPWFTEGIYHGSWYHYPPLRYAPRDFADVDALYLSHIHPDHFDAEALRQFPKEMPVYIHEYAEKYLLKGLTRLGFTKVREVPHKGRVELGPDFRMEVLSADNCDPTVCGRFFGCVFPGSMRLTMQIDSMAVFRGGGKTVINANDCPYPLAQPVCDYLKKEYGTVDFLMVGYGGAGEYPQCFDEEMDEATLAENASRKKGQMLHQTAQYLRHLQPASFMPFAGLYVLGGRFAHRNRFRGVPELEELPAEFSALLQKHGLSSRMVLLNSGEWFDVDRQAASAPFTPPDPAERARYIREVLGGKAYEYETRFRAKERADLTPALREAQGRMWKYQELCGYRSDWKVYLDTGEDQLYRVPYNGQPVDRVPRDAEEQPYVRIRLDYSLLKMILERKAHWNNVIIGSHLTFARKPEVFDRAVYQVLCYLC